MSTSGSRSLHDRVVKRLRDLPRSGIREFFDIVSGRKDVISLGIGEPDFDTPWHICEAALFALEHGATGYTSNSGLLKLRQALSGYVERTFGPRYDPENEILITVGVSEALDLALRALVDTGDEVLYHEPCYVSYMPVIAMAGGTPVAVVTRREDGFRLQRRDLEERVTPRTRVLVLNYPNNPTGAVLDRADLEELAAFAIQHDLVVLTDEIYGELSYDAPHASIAALPGMRERTVFFHGFSKAWAMTGFRLGYACGPQEIIDGMLKLHQYTMLCAPILAQEAGVEALRQPEQDIAVMRDEYQRRRNFLHASLEEMGLPCSRPAGAFYAFPYVGHLGLSSREFSLRLLEEENVAMVPGTAFGSCGEGFARCAYAASMDDIKEAMVRLARFVERLRGT